MKRSEARKPHARERSEQTNQFRWWRDRVLMRSDGKRGHAHKASAHDVCFGAYFLTKQSAGTTCYGLSLFKKGQSIGHELFLATIARGSHSHAIRDTKRSPASVQAHQRVSLSSKRGNILKVGTLGLVGKESTSFAPTVINNFVSAATESFRRSQ